MDRIPEEMVGGLKIGRLGRKPYTGDGPGPFSDVREFMEYISSYFDRVAPMVLPEKKREEGDNLIGNDSKYERFREGLSREVWNILCSLKVGSFHLDVSEEALEPKHIVLLLEFVASNPTLTHLSFNNCNIENWVYQIPNHVTFLRLNDNKIPSITASTLPSSLTTFSASGNQLTSVDFTDWPEGVTRVTLSGNSSLQSIHHWDMLPNLPPQNVHLVGCPVESQWILSFTERSGQVEPAS